LIHEIYSSSYRLSFGIKKSLYHFFIADITEGSNQFTLLIVQSNPSSQKNKNLSISLICAMFHSWIRMYMAIAMDRSKLVPTFFMSDGAKFNINFWRGRFIQALRNVDLRRSLDSFMAVSGNHIISMFGRDLFESASTTISCHCNQMFIKVFVVRTILKFIVK
jgi:hypothetical protein